MTTEFITTFYIKSFGCQMNQYDSDLLTKQLISLNLTLVDNHKLADIVILNTCYIREKASEKVFSELGIIKKNNTSKIIGVVGCLAQAQGNLIFKRAPYVDFIAGPQSIQKVADIIKAIIAKLNSKSPLSYQHPFAKQDMILDEAKDSVKRDVFVDNNFSKTDGKNSKLFNISELDFNPLEKFNSLKDLPPFAPLNNKISSFITVQEGCDKFCSFCVVPFTRGSEYSRKSSEIIDEASALVDKGVLEITLLGQNVNAYHGLNQNGLEISLADLIMEIEQKLPSLKRIRFTTSHPLEMTEQLINLYSYSEKLMPYLHLPLQSGSDRILKLMNRKHSLEKYLEIIYKLKQARGDIAISTDIIVGFPTESEEDFLKTLAAIDTVKFAQSYSFIYSKRPGTPAFSKTEQIEKETAKNRINKIQELLFFYQKEFNQQFINQNLPVLIEKAGKQPDTWLGRSPYLQNVIVSSQKNILGKIIDASVTDVSSHLLYAKLISKYVNS